MKHKRRKRVYEIRKDGKISRRPDGSRIFFLSRKKAKEIADLIGGTVHNKKVV
jgi:hypothetical protein